MLKKITHIVFFLVFASLVAQKQTFTLIIDAGHGGKDPGAKGHHGTQEKEITLAVALLLGQKIKQQLSDVKIVYTRQTDVFIPLIERSKIANKNKGALFISIHCNSTPNEHKPVHGAETYVLGMHKTKINFEVAKRENNVIFLEKDYKLTYRGYNPNAPESMIGWTLMQNNYLDKSISFANQIQKQFERISRENRGVKQAGFLVIREVAMPAVLIEIGFLSHPQEASYLNSSAGQKAITKAIFDAFVSFKKDYDKRNRTPLINPIKEKKEAEKKNIKNKGAYTEEVLFLKGVWPSVEILRDDAPRAKSSEVIGLENQTLDTNKKTENSKQDSLASLVSSFMSKDALKKQQDKNIRTPKNRVVFKVQLAVSKQKLSKEHQLYKKFPEVVYYLEDQIYKYTIGNSSVLGEMFILQQKAKQLGYIDAFVVAFDGKKRISIEKARELTEK